MAKKKIEWVNITQLHEATGIHRDTIRPKLKGLPYKEGAQNAKLYDKAVVLPILFDSGGAREDLESKERKAKADAEKAELIVAKLRGELVSVERMKSSAAGLVKTLYARTVRVLPNTLAPKLQGKSVAECEVILRDELSAIFDELKNRPDNFFSITTEIGVEIDFDTTDEEAT